MLSKLLVTWGPAVSCPGTGPVSIALTDLDGLYKPVSIKFTATDGFFNECRCCSTYTVKNNGGGEYVRPSHIRSSARSEWHRFCTTPKISRTPTMKSHRTTSTKQIPRRANHIEPRHLLVMMSIITRPTLWQAMKAVLLTSKSMRRFWTKNRLQQEAGRHRKMPWNTLSWRGRVCLKMLLFSSRWHDIG